MKPTKSKWIECYRCGWVGTVAKHIPLKLAWCRNCGSSRIRIYHAPKPRVDSRPAPLSEQDAMDAARQLDLSNRLAAISQTVQTFVPAGAWTCSCGVCDEKNRNEGNKNDSNNLPH